MSQPKPSQYDPHIVPAEVAARQEREQEEFRHTPQPTDAEAIDTRSGYTVDQEGLINNYAIEPEMYINEPGDLREEEEALAAEQARARAELSESEAGRLTMEQDTRHKGQGLV